MTMISSSQKVYSPDDVLKQLDSSITCIKQNIQCYCRDPLRDFTRSRKLDVDMIIRFLIQMESKSMKSELCNYFDNMDSLPTDSALCQQRNKLLPEAMKRVLYLFTRSFKHSKTINNYYLLAADGSDVNISFDPNDTATIRDLGDERQCSQYHINALYDCLNHIYWNVNIDSSKKTREQDALKDMINDHDHPMKSIITADRGYEGYDLIACCQENNQKFVFRVKDKDVNSSILKNLELPNDEFDIIVQKTIARKQTNEIKENKKKYVKLVNHLKFTYLDINEDFYEMKFRVVRFKISEDTYECLITNLAKDEFSLSDLKRLYELRWQIETSFRKLKYAIGLTFFHSKKREFIKQEIYARMILYNLSSIIASNIEVKEKGKKHLLNFNFALAVTNIRLYLRRAFDGNELARRIKKYLVPVRPDRSYPRYVKPQTTKSFNNRAA